MARKTALLKITVEGIPKAWRWQIDNLKKFVPVEGTEQRWDRHVTATAERLKQQARFDQACDLHEQHNSDESRALMKVEGDKLNRLMHAEFGALDAWTHQCKHMNDKILMPEEDVREVVIASLSDKLEELQFTVNYGMLGGKIAQAIRHTVSEDDTMVPPLCAEHA